MSGSTKVTTLKRPVFYHEFIVKVNHLFSLCHVRFANWSITLYGLRRLQFKIPLFQSIVHFCPMLAQGFGQARF